jgi:hypothetical protein
MPKRSFIKSIPAADLATLEGHALVPGKNFFKLPKVL